MKAVYNINLLTKLALAGSVLYLGACGDDATTEWTTNRVSESDVVSSIDDLPECSKEMKGEQVFVKDESAIYVCYGKDWKIAGYYSNSENDEISCLTEPLKDDSGIKILCNGDSVGVVLNGLDGKKGSDGEAKGNGVGCTFIDNGNASVSIICGNDTLSYKVGSSVSKDVVDMLKLQGTSQKGPFVQGTKVYAYELEDGKSLLQTSRSFVGSIQGNDGKFLIPSVSLKSPYVLLEANGYFLNEVTGQRSKSPISLFALTDLMGREKVNVNLLTHLEYYRVRHLVLEENMNIAKAREQAEREVFAAFNIDNSKFKSPEDLDIFSSGDDNAALLAISVLLAQEQSEGELTDFLSELSADLADDGVWDDDSTRLKIASWAWQLNHNSWSGRNTELDYIREHVESWQLGDTVPMFETYMSVFWGVEFGLGVCGSDSVPIGTIKFVTRKEVKNLYAKNYEDDSNTFIRFICEDNPIRQWRVADFLEEDTYGWGSDCEGGEVRQGRVNKDSAYVCVGNGQWQHGIYYDVEIYNAGGKACCRATDGDIYEYDGERYICLVHPDYMRGDDLRQWVPTAWLGSAEGRYYFNNSVEFGSLKDSRDGKVYRTVVIGEKVWMAENLLFEGGENGSWHTNLEGVVYDWNAAKNGNVCPENWHVASKEEWENLYEVAQSVSENVGIVLKSRLGWFQYGTDDLGICIRRSDPDFNANFVGDRSAFFWTSTESSTDDEIYNRKAMSFIVTEEDEYFIPVNESEYMHIRCVKD